MNDIDERITAALDAAANTITERELRPELRSADRPVPQRRRWLAPALVAAAVVCLGVGLAVAFRPAGNPSTLGAGGSPTSSLATGDPACDFWAELNCARSDPQAFVPLWPYASLADRPTDPTASQLDAVSTALRFVQDYVGFTGITSGSLAVAAGDDNAYVRVGADDSTTAAYVHLVRYEETYGDTTAPWEVVGTTTGDTAELYPTTSLQLDQPAYGSDLTSPMTVGGPDRGGDLTMVRVTLRSLSSDLRAMAWDCCQAMTTATAHDPWHVTVDLASTMDQTAQPTGALAVIASTGGTYLTPDQFAVTAVRASN